MKERKKDKLPQAWGEAKNIMVFRGEAKITLDY
jgi:hypothetical protein